MQIDKGFPRSLMFLVEQISPVTEVQQKLSNTLSRRQVLQEIPVPVANNETTITTNREERVTVSSRANETQQTTGIIFPGVNETERILQGHTLSSPAINNVAVSTI